MSSNRGQTETFWQLSTVIVILTVGTCLRFYSLDQNSLSSDELRNLATCDIKGWLAMIRDYHSNNGGMPPLYPMLLCLVTHLTSDSEFFVRTLSALCGLGAIYFLYITGRDFVSPTAGLLAAAVMASDLRTILLNRDATLYSLLLLLMLMHNYCFCRLFFSAARYARQPLVLGYSGSNIILQYSWQPVFPGNAACLAGFWLSGLAAFYTSPMSLIQLAGELCASALLIKQATCFPSWRAGMRSIWLPLLIGMLPWLPMFYKSSEWILQGNLFGLQTTNLVWQQIRNLLPISPISQYLLLTLLVILVLSMLALNIKPIKRFEKIQPCLNIFCCYALLQSGIAVISVWLILPASQLSYFYFWWILILLMLAPLSLSIDCIPGNLRNLLTTIIILIILTSQILSNAYYKFYNLGGNADFRLVAKIIHDDQNFMAGDKNIVMSTALFNHHLEKAGIIAHNTTILDNNELPATIDITDNNSEFYYLEYHPYDRELPNETAAFQKISAQHKKLCTTTMPWLQIAKFSHSTPVNSDTVPDCRNYLSDVITLK